MTTPRGDEQQPWVGRSTPRPPRDPWREPSPTAQQPVVPSDLPPVIYVQAPRGRWGFVVALVLLSFAAGAVVAVLTSPALRQAIGMEPDATPSATPPESPTPSPTPTTPPPPGVGDPVQDGTFEFVVSEVTCGQSSVEWGILRESADGQYCLVEIAVTNTGNLPALFVDRAQHVYASDGSRHRADATAGFIANEGTAVWANLVLAGGTTGGILVFDIPAQTTPVVVELHDSLFSDGTVVTIGPAPAPSADD